MWITLELSGSEMRDHVIFLTISNHNFPAAHNFNSKRWKCSSDIFWPQLIIASLVLLQQISFVSLMRVVTWQKVVANVGGDIQLSRMIESLWYDYWRLLRQHELNTKKKQINEPKNHLGSIVRWTTTILDAFSSSMNVVCSKRLTDNVTT